MLRVLFLTDAPEAQGLSGDRDEICAALPAALRRAGAELRRVMPLRASSRRYAAGAECVYSGVLPRDRDGEGEIRFSVLRALRGGESVYLISLDGEPYAPEAFSHGRPRVCVPDASGPEGKIGGSRNTFRGVGGTRFRGGSGPIGGIGTVGSAAESVRERQDRICARAFLTALPHLGFFPDVLHSCGDGFGDRVVRLLHSYGNLLRERDSRFAALRTVTVVGVSPRGGECRGFDPRTLSALRCSDGALFVGSDRSFAAASEYIGRYGGGELLRLEIGIDTEFYDPALDSCLPCRFAADDMDGKLCCKAELQRRLLLPQRLRVPLAGVMLRPDGDAGARELLHALPELSRCEMQLVILGAGEGAYFEHFRAAAHRRPDCIALVRRFDRRTMKLILAGADLCLLPEGGGQCSADPLLAARYGAVPVMYGRRGEAVSGPEGGGPEGGDPRGITVRARCSRGPACGGDAYCPGGTPLVDCGGGSGGMTLHLTPRSACGLYGSEPERLRGIASCLMRRDLSADGAAAVTVRFYEKLCGK